MGDEQFAGMSSMHIVGAEVAKLLLSGARYHRVTMQCRTEITIRIC